MNEEQNNQKKEPTKVTVGLVLGWGLGVLAAISGVALLFSEPLTGILMLLLAAVLLPPANKFVADKFNFSISGGMKVIVVIGLLIVIGISAPTDSQTENFVDTDNNSAQTQENETNSDNGTENENNDSTSATQNQPTQTQSEPEPEPETPSETVSQKNAVRKAKSYIDFSAFSRDGLVEQLKFDQFSHADAVYGADNSGADWYEQAAKKAESYMEFSAFSRGSLIEQLKFDGFTQAQAEHGADAVGL